MCNAAASGGVGADVRVQHVLSFFLLLLVALAIIRGRQGCLCDEIVLRPTWSFRTIHTKNNNQVCGNGVVAPCIIDGFTPSPVNPALEGTASPVGESIFRFFDIRLYVYVC